MLKSSYPPLLALLGFLAPLTPVHACGWWGDGEMSRHASAGPAAPDGKTVNTKLDIASARLPQRQGYAIAVTGPGLAIPYLQATYGRKLNRIPDLKAFGFAAIIDLGTPAKTARLHRAESEAAGMRYMSIPVAGDTPEPRQTGLFNQMIAKSGSAPLLVYAPSAPLLAFFWAAHRISLGAPLAFAIQQGKSLGLTPGQGTVLRKRVAAEKNKQG